MTIPLFFETNVPVTKELPLLRELGKGGPVEPGPFSYPLDHYVDRGGAR